MKRMLFGFGLGAILASSAAAQVAPRQVVQERREVQQERRDTPPSENRRDPQTQERREVQAQERREGQAQERREERRDDRTLSGRVTRTGNGQFVVTTRDNRQVTVYTNPQTRYLQNNKAVQYSDLRVGSNVNFGYALDGERYIANTVTLVPAQTTQPANPAPREEVRTQPAPIEGTAVEGQIVRVIGQDRVVIRTADNKEVIVYVTPQTTYQLGTPQAATFTDLRVGTPIGVQYDVRDDRHTARRFFAPRRNNR